MRKLLFIIMIFWTGTALAQLEGQAFIDSLLSVLSHAKEDSNQVIVLNKLCDQYEQLKQFSPSITYGERGLALAKKIRYAKGEARGYLNLALVYRNMANDAKALEYYTNSIRIFASLGDNRRAADLYLTIGDIYARLSDYPKAWELYFKSLKISEEYGFKDDISDGYNDVGRIYALQGDYSNALKYYFKSLKIQKEIKSIQSIYELYTDIGSIYHFQSNYPKALEYYFKSLKLEKEKKNKQAMSITFNSIGRVYTDYFEKDSSNALLTFLQDGHKRLIHHADLTDSALVLHKTALAMDRETGKKFQSIDGLFGIAKVLILQKKYPAAIRYYYQSYLIADSLKAINQKKAAALYLSDSYKKLKDYAKALSWQETFIILKDSIFSQDKSRQITSTAMNYEFEKKEIATATAAAKEKAKEIFIRNSFIAGFSVVFLFSLVVFRQRNKIQKGKRQSDKLLLNILPIEVANELKIRGESAARQFDNVTVLFTDFINFTGISETLSPKELVNELHQCFKAFDDITDKFGLEKIKTIGDAYLAACGLPTADINHAEKVVNAALEMNMFISNRKKQGGIFSMRTGIHSGSVVAGIVGVKKFAYDIWGDAVNTAARMEQNSADGKINVSENTYELIKDKFTCTYRGKVEAKNKGCIDMYFVEVN